MQVYTDLNEIELNKKTIVALGNFDGLHIGHMELIRTAVNVAKERGLLAGCFTFSNHPREVKYVCTEEEKLELLENAGVDVVFNVPFDETVKNTSAEKFVREILSVKLNAAGVVCGFNYRFGKMAKGNIDLLREIGAEIDMDVYVEEAVSIDGEIVSSTLVRKYIDEGNMEKVTAFLGRYYSARGVVVRGNRLGRALGFPTANIVFEDYRVAPPNGVYYTYAYIDGVRYPSITNVGHKPTIGKFEKSIETYIYDFAEDLYNKEIMIEFIHFKRPEMKFESVQELATQVTMDKDAGYLYHKERGDI